MVRKDRYCVCTHLENQQTRGFQGAMVKRVFDSAQFSHPEDDPSALERLLHRKKQLESEGKKSVQAIVVAQV